MPSHYVNDSLEHPPSIHSTHCDTVARSFGAEKEPVGPWKHAGLPNTRQATVSAYIDPVSRP